MTMSARPSLPSKYRDVLGRVPTGVAVITAMIDEGPVGVACNSCRYPDRHRVSQAGALL
jgi:flavin reductase (DIM6/NTAB) family NADH-FMN oxidoreductase RutF